MLAGLISASSFIIFLWLYTLHNTQPMQYHPDAGWLKANGYKMKQVFADAAVYCTVTGTPP